MVVLCCSSSEPTMLMCQPFYHIPFIIVKDTTIDNIQLTPINAKAQIVLELVNPITLLWKVETMV